MVNNRNGFTYIANITVLVVSLVCFIFICNGKLCFSVLTVIVLSYGAFMSGFYICLIKEKDLSA